MAITNEWRDRHDRPPTECRCVARNHRSHPDIDCNRPLRSQSSREAGVCGLCVSDVYNGSNRVMGGALTFKPRGPDGRFLPEPFHRMEDA